MTADILFIADPTDPNYPWEPSTVLIDLNEGDWHMAAGFGIVDDEESFDLGALQIDPVLISQAPHLGATASTEDFPPVQMTIPLFLYVSDYEDARSRVLALGSALMSSGVLVWQPDGQDEPLYIDYLPSSVPALFRGQERGMWKLTQLLRDPDGYPLQLLREPGMRLAPTTLATSVSVSNSVGAGTVRLENPGNLPSPCKLTVAFPGSDADVVQTRVSRRSGTTDQLDEFETFYSQDVSAVDGSCGNFWSKSWDVSINPTDENSLIGTYRVYCIMSFDSDTQYHLQLRWGFTSINPLANREEIRDIDADDVGGRPLIEVYLGTVRFDRSVDRLRMQLWLKADDDGSDVTFDQVVLMPAGLGDQFITMSSPGWRHGTFGLEEWTGDDLVLSGNADPDVRHRSNDGELMLYDVDEMGTTRPTAGQTQPVGRHVVEFDGVVENVDRIAETVGELEVLKNGSLLTRRLLKSRRGELQTRYGSDRRRICTFDVETSGGDQYAFAVKQTVDAATADTHRKGIHIAKIKHSFIPQVEDGYAMVGDSAERRAYITTAAGVRYWPLRSTGLVMLAPGVQDLVFRFGKTPPKGWDDAYWREPLARGQATSAEVTVWCVPKVSH